MQIHQIIKITNYDPRQPYFVGDNLFWDQKENQFTIKEEGNEKTNLVILTPPTVDDYWMECSQTEHFCDNTKTKNGFKIFEPVLTVDAIVTSKDHRILLIKRKNPPFG